MVLAVDFVVMVANRACDVGILFSSDTDLVPALGSCAGVAASGPAGLRSGRLGCPRYAPALAFGARASIRRHLLSKAYYRTVADLTDYTRSDLRSRCVTSAAMRPPRGEPCRQPPAPLDLAPAARLLPASSPPCPRRVMAALSAALPPRRSPSGLARAPATIPMPEPFSVTCGMCSTARQAAADAEECLAGIDAGLPGLTFC